VSREEVHWDLIRLALMSVANTAIVPVQDILGLGEETRMNRPAGGTGNWQWRLTPQQFQDIPGDELKHMLWLYGRR
ncbi:MAG: 4-alpha-glucanotransferase, partial [Candidatus Hadarchaeota archaeon]